MNRDAVDEREPLQVFREHGCEVSCERHVRADEYAIPTGHRQTHALIVRVAKTDGKAASFHFGCQVENAEGLHAVRRYRVFVVNDSDVAKAQRLEEGLHDLVMRDRTVRFRCRRCRHQR